MIGLLLLILLILLVAGSVPAWPHSRGWGYGPSGILGVLLLLLLVLMLFNVVPAPWGGPVVVHTP